MQRGNNESYGEVIQRIERARSLLDEALKLSQKIKPNTSRSSTRTAAKAQVTLSSIDLSMPIRAFVKKYAQNMSGAKKFTLLIAHQTKGDSSKTVALAEIEKHWNKMTAKGLLGMKFNRLYTSQARENDWATTAKTGAYHLRPGWKAIFG